MENGKWRIENEIQLFFNVVQSSIIKYISTIPLTDFHFNFVVFMFIIGLIFLILIK